MGPLGSFIQLRAGSRWNCGRRGSLANSDAEFGANAMATREGRAAAAAMMAVEERKIRRLVFMLAVLSWGFLTLCGIIPCSRESEVSGRGRALAIAHSPRR